MPRSDSPSSRISPARGARRPETVFSVVVFPAPLLPRRATISPAATLREIPLTALISPYVTSRSRTSSMRPAPQVGLDHARVTPHVGRGALGDLLAVVQRSEERRVGKEW